MAALPAWANAVVTLGHGPRGDRWWRALLQAGLKMGVVRAVTDLDETKYRNRELIFWREARRRGLEVVSLEVAGTPLNQFRWRFGKNEFFYEGNPLHLFASPATPGDKAQQKRRLEAAGVPVAQGAKFFTEEAGAAFAELLRVPVVVKPNAGSLSHHVTVGVEGEVAVREAIRRAQRYRPDYLIETAVPGRLFRATVIGQGRVFVCRKDPPHVVGDGHSTVADLVAAKNAHPWRGAAADRTKTLHWLDLAGSAVDPVRVPSLGERVLLQEKCVLSQGCDIVACHDVHPDNLALFRKVAEVMGMDLAGIDFLCADVTQSWRAQSCAVLEVNSMPYLDMHQYPSEGKPEDVAKEVWNWVLARAGQK